MICQEDFVSYEIHSQYITEGICILNSKLPAITIYHTGISKGMYAPCHLVSIYMPRRFSSFVL